MRRSDFRYLTISVAILAGSCKVAAKLKRRVRGMGQGSSSKK